MHFDLGKHRQLVRGDPVSIAKAAHAAPLPTRGPHLLQALLHSAHALNVPVQLGVSFLSKCQAFFWSLQHSICDFETAIFLSKWLTALATTQHIERLDSKWVRFQQYYCGIRVNHSSFRERTTSLKVDLEHHSGS